MCNELDAALVAFDDVYTAYHQLLDENDIDDSKAYYDLVLKDVQELKHQAGQLLDNVPVHGNEPPAQAEPQTKTGNQTGIQHQAQAEGQMTYETEDISQAISRTQVDEINRLKAEIKELKGEKKQYMQSTFRESVSTDQSFAQFLELSKLQYKIHANSIRLPPTELFKFNGGPLQYCTFMHLLKNLVDKPTISDPEKIMRLHQFISGRVQKSTTSCLYFANAQEGYKEALQRLKSNYCDQTTIARALSKKVLSFKDVKSHEQVKDYANVLRGAFDTLKAFTRKLPYDMRSKWLSKNYEITKSDRSASLKDIVKFVEAESAKRSDPIFGDFLTPNTRLSGAHGQSGSKIADNDEPSKGQHFATAVDKRGVNKVSSKLRCPKCTATHFLNQCSQFRASTVDDGLRCLFPQLDMW